jgi:predicted RNase H-like nuclease
MHVAGVDGCRGGWICVHQSQDIVKGKVCANFLQVIDYLGPVSAIAVDIPIGLQGRGARSCDKAARKLLGWPRRNSVFSAPVWAVISETNYITACVKHREVDGRALSKQAFCILPKIREVNEIIINRPHLQVHIHEVHPEVCFTVWNNGKPMLSKKGSSPGIAERASLIDNEWPGERERLARELGGSGYGIDDLNDAFAALWSAKRIAADIAEVFGSRETDHCGLRMEIWA